MNWSSKTSPRGSISALKRTAKRPRFPTVDRVFWILMAHTWRHWRTSINAGAPVSPSVGHEDPEHPVDRREPWTLGGALQRADAAAGRGFRGPIHDVLRRSGRTLGPRGKSSPPP